MAIIKEFIVDVGSSSVGACILESISGAKPTLSRVVRIPIGTGSETTRANIASATGEALKALFDKYRDAPRPARVRVVLASPWYSAKLRAIASKAPKPVKVSIGSIAKTVKEYKAKKPEKDAPEGPKGRTIESIVSQVYVNGYATALKKTVHGTALRIHLYESEADPSFLDVITDKVHSLYPTVALSFHSFPLIAFTVLRSIRDEENFTLLDVGGEVTDVAVIHRDSMRFLGSFPKGSLTFVRSVSGAKSAADASSRLSLYAMNELSNEETATFAKVFETAAASWNQDYERALESALTDVAIPQTTFLAADKEELRWFEQVLKSGHGVFPARPTLMTPDFFQGDIVLGDAGAYDAFLSLEAIFFNAPHRDLIEV
jgi:hypothetical protein